jgi:hypothetical protein
MARKSRRANTSPSPVSSTPTVSTFRLPACTCDDCNKRLYPEKRHGNGIPSQPGSRTAPFRSESLKHYTAFYLNDVSRYESLTLVNAVIDWLDQEIKAYTPRQRAAIDEFKLWQADHANDEYGKVSLSHLKYIVGLFNEIFFWGSLRHLDVRLARKDSGSIAYTQCANVDRADYPEGYSMEIPVPTIYVNLATIAEERKALGLHDVEEVGTSITEIEFIYSQLLHEMCHAFLLVYTCCGTLHGENSWTLHQRCDKPEACTALAKDNHGMSGHGRAWFRLTDFVEENSVKILGINLKLKGLPDLFVELESIDGWVPSQCDFNKFFSRADAEYLENIHLARMAPDFSTLPALEKAQRKEVDDETVTRYEGEKNAAIHDIIKELTDHAQRTDIFTAKGDIKKKEQKRFKEFHDEIKGVTMRTVPQQKLTKARRNKQVSMRNAELIDAWRAENAYRDIRSDKAKLKLGEVSRWELRSDKPCSKSSSPSHSRGISRTMDKTKRSRHERTPTRTAKSPSLSSVDEEDIGTGIRTPGSVDDSATSILKLKTSASGKRQTASNDADKVLNGDIKKTPKNTKAPVRQGRKSRKVKEGKDSMSPNPQFEKENQKPPERNSSLSSGPRRVSRTPSQRKTDDLQKELGLI